MFSKKEKQKIYEIIFFKILKVIKTIIIKKMKAKQYLPLTKFVS